MDSAALRNLFEVVQARARGEKVALRFAGADLRGAFLLRANLSGGTFEAVRFEHANLSGARLAGATLTGSCLAQADLNGADLTGADARNVDFSEARLEGSCFANADLRGANLGLSRGQPLSVAGMLIDHATFRRSQMPEATAIQLWRDGALLEDLRAFPERVRRACREDPTDHAPSGRDVAMAEAEHRNRRMPSIAPHSLRRGAEAMPRRRASGELKWAAATAGGELLGVTLVECLGKGPHGSVWKAKDADGATRAIKIFEPGSRPDDERAAAFKRGVDTLNRAALFDEQGQTRLVSLTAVATSGLAFVYEYFDNGNATGIPALGWDIPRILEFFGEVCRGVAELHELGLAWGTLKPSNVLIDNELRPVLTDVGMRGLPDPNAELSAEDAAFRAPEELTAEGTHSPTADIFSLGRLLWFLFLGRNPEEPTQAIAELASLQRYPAGLVRIIRKATALDPALRYQWVRELEADLACYDLHETVGLAGTRPDKNVLPYFVSSLPPPPRRPADEVRIPRDKPPSFDPDRPATERRPRSTERLLAGLGFGIAALAATFTALTPLPTPREARFLGVALSVGLALGTLLIAPYPRRPILSRLALMGAVLSLLTAFEVERLVTLRWKATLGSGALEQRSRAAALLARSGMRDLRGAKLARSELRGADLGRVDLRGADLRGANLTDTNLAEADLRGARIDGANLSNANLFASLLDRGGSLSEAHCDGLTTLPQRFSCENGHPASASP